MHPMTRLMPATLVLGTLAACGGGGGGQLASFDDLSAEQVSLAEAAVAVDRTPVADMPSTGSASYDGVAGFSIGTMPQTTEDLNILSELALTADFASGAISGSLSNFNSAEGEDIEGTLALTNGQISDNTFTADAAGTLTRGGAALATDLDMEGAFGGADAALLTGTATGMAGADDMYGVFWAQ